MAHEDGKSYLIEVILDPPYWFPKSKVRFIISDLKNPYIHIWTKGQSSEKCMPQGNFLLFSV